MALRKPPLTEPNFTHIFSRPAVPFSESNKKVPKVTVTTSARHQPGIEVFPDELEDELTQDIYRDWISFFARKYKEALIDAILNQEFKDRPLPKRFGGGRWPPLSEDYARYKRVNGLPGAESHWWRSGQLMDAIETRFFPQVGKNGAWGVGIPSTATFKKVVTTDRGWYLGQDTGKRILFIARILEFGAAGAGIPPRPLFRPIKDRLRKNVRSLVEDFIAQESVE